MATTELAERNGAAQKPSSDNIPALYARLCVPMPTHARTLSGRPLQYISGQQCIQRLNDTLGADRWSFAITERWYEQDSDCCCVRGLLTIRWPDGAVTHHEDVGGQVVNRRRDNGTAVEIANDWKGARTDCLKRCAADVGIGLWLYGDDMPSPETDAVDSKSGADRSNGDCSDRQSAARGAAPSGGVAQPVDRAALQPAVSGQGAADPPAGSQLGLRAEIGHPPACVDCEKPIKRVRLMNTGEVLEAEEIRERSLRTFGRVLCAACAGTEAAVVKEQLARHAQEATY